MWCLKCHHGSIWFWREFGQVCPMCKNDKFTDKNPFPSTPTGMGSGKENGKTKKKREGRASRFSQPVEETKVGSFK